MQGWRLGAISRIVLNSLTRDCSQSIGVLVLSQASAKYAQEPWNRFAFSRGRPFGDVMKFRAKSSEREGNAWVLGCK